MTSSTSPEAGRVSRAVLVAIIAISHAASAGGQAADTVVKSVSQPRYRGVATLVPELTIGMMEGPPEYLFTGIADLVVLKDGSVVVLDALATRTPAIRHYTANGKFIRNIGRHGAGPGEFWRPRLLAQHPDGRILVTDDLNHRMNVYASDGTPLPSWPLIGYKSADGGLPRMSVSSDGTTFVPFIPKEPGSRTAPVLQMDSKGAIKDTIAYALRGKATSGPAPYYSPGHRVLWSSFGYWVTSFGSRYAIQLERPGQKVISIRRSMPPVPIRADERDFRERLPIADGLKRPKEPLVKPFIHSLRVAADHRIWVQISTPSERYNAPKWECPFEGITCDERRHLTAVPWREPEVYDVYEPDGSYLGQVRVPYNVELKYMQGDVVWASVKDDDDVVTVVGYRIAWRR